MLRGTMRLLRLLWVEGEICSLLPSKVGRYRVVDTLQQWEDRFLKIPAGAGLGTREKMVRLPDVPPAESFSGKKDEQAWQTE